MDELKKRIGNHNNYETVPRSRGRLLKNKQQQRISPSGSDSLLNKMRIIVISGPFCQYLNARNARQCWYEKEDYKEDQSNISLIAG